MTCRTELLLTRCCPRRSSREDVKAEERSSIGGSEISEICRSCEKGDIRRLKEEARGCTEVVDSSSGVDSFFQCSSYIQVRRKRGDLSIGNLDKLEKNDDSQ